jgi:hypothetical protein
LGGACSTQEKLEMHEKDWFENLEDLDKMNMFQRKRTWGFGLDLCKERRLLDVALCRSCLNRLFGETYRLHLQGRKISEQGTSVKRLSLICSHLLTLVPRSLIFLP